MMKIALTEARKAFDMDAVPVGAVIVLNNTVIAKSHNDIKPFEHAEFMVIQKAYNLIGHNIRNASIYITLEPCIMCIGMIINMQIKNIYFGAYDTKSGALDNVIFKNSDIIHGKIKEYGGNIYGGIMEQECSDLLKEFFKKKRIQYYGNK